MEQLISKEYQYKITDYHSKRQWGGAVINKVADIHKYVTLTNAKTVLDYGAGSGSLKTTLNNYSYDLDYEVVEYEPGKPELSSDPPKCDFLVCCDVLEHIEPEKIDAVLKHMYDKTAMFAFMTISTQPALSAFPGGENLHLLVRPAEWWIEKLNKHWKFIELIVTKGGITLLCEKV